MTRPTVTGSSPDLNTATQAASPISRCRAPKRMPRNRSTASMRQQHDAHDQRHHVHPAAVDHGDDDDAGQVVDDREREQVGPHPVGQAPADQGQRAERERGVGGHGRAPAVRGRAAGGEGQVQRDRHDHPAQPGRQRQGQPAALAQFAHVELAPGLDRHDQEEERHQAGVHPAVQVLAQARRAQVHGQLGVPERGVGAGADVHPHQRGQRRPEQERGAAGLGAQEAPQRRDLPGPEGGPDLPDGRLPRFRHATKLNYLPHQGRM